MKVEFGLCANCERAVANDCGSCNSKTPNEHYTEVLMNLSNGSKMVIAVCKDCATDNKIFEADKEALMEAVKAGWLKGLKNSPKELIERHKESVKDLKIVD